MLDRAHAADRALHFPCASQKDASSGLLSHRPDALSPDKLLLGASGTTDSDSSLAAVAKVYRKPSQAQNSKSDADAMWVPHQRADSPPRTLNQTTRFVMGNGSTLMSIAQHINGLIEYHFHGLFTCVDCAKTWFLSALSVPFRKAQVPIRPSDDGFLFLGNPHNQN